MNLHSTLINEIIGFSISVLLLVIFYGLFSALESALTVIDKAAWMSGSNKHHSKIYRLGVFFIQHYYLALNVVLISETLASVGAASLSTILFTDVGLYSGLNNAESFGAGISTGLLTLLLLVIGDSIPKTIAKKKPVQVYKSLIFFFVFFYFLFWILGWLLTKIIPHKKQISASQKELKNLITVMNAEGTIDDQAESLINRTIDFTNATIAEAITPKKEICKINVDADYFQTYDAFINSGFSRIIVVDENDQIIGIALLKLFIPYLDPRVDEKNAETFNMQDIMEDPLILSKDDKLDDALRKMQIQHIHLAIVATSYENKTLYNVITFEDIIEKIFGPIHDEYEKNDNAMHEQIDDDTWKVVGTLDLNEFLKSHFDLDYHLPPKTSVYQFVKMQVRKNKSLHYKDLKWEDDKIIIYWNQSIITKKLLFVIQKKLKQEDEDQHSLTSILFGSYDEEDELNKEKDQTKETYS